MKEIHLLSKNERGLFFKTASDIKEMPLEIIEKDYELMESMLFREIPTWELILKTIEQFEKEFNCID